MADDTRKCSDCNVPLALIKLIDRGHFNVEQDVEYALPGAKRGFWSSAYPKEGRVEAFMCSQCGRITLYGAPRGRD